MKILISSGGTKIPIDLVRDITNMSTGTFGSKIANEVLKLGHQVVFFKSKGSKTPMQKTVNLVDQYDIGSFTKWHNEQIKLVSNYVEYEYSTFDQYKDGLKFVIGVEQPDVIVLAAAVSDYGVENFVSGKIRSNDLLSIKLKQLPKLIYYVKQWAPNSKLVGFKMLVNSKEHELIDAAKMSINDNNCDLIVANDLQNIRDNNHKVHLVKSLNKQRATLGGVLETFEVETYKSTPEDPNYLAKMVAMKIVNL